MRYTVIGLISASKIIGTYEADSKEEAIEKAELDRNADASVTICHACSRKVEVGDIYEYIAEEDEKQ